MKENDKFDVNTKIGLALSGGGFRASLFHIGTMAKLAELNMLSEIQVLSTVSGGSIVGALYYLKVKQLLEGTRPDNLAPSNFAYIKIISEIEQEFLEGVQKNLRMRAILNPLKTARMFFSDEYSRSNRMAELYQQYFYSKVWKEMYPNYEGDIKLSDIKITPIGQKKDFDINEYNKTAIYKIPILEINATVLNTGDPWVFTSSYIEVNKNELNLPNSKLYFNNNSLSDKGKKKLNDITLADAVAASACVPTLLAPFAIHDLCQDVDGKEIVIELVDGGLYDNQGVETLTRNKCTEIICSDGTGQLQTQRVPASDGIEVSSRSNDILMKRVREEVIKFCKKEVEKFSFWDLKRQFKTKEKLPNFSSKNDKSDNQELVNYLSSLRTDLDSFSDIEAYSLMYDAYCLCDEQLGNGQIEKEWKFLTIRKLIENESEKLAKHLDVGAKNFFKTFRLLGKLGWVFASALIVGVFIFIWWAGIYPWLKELCQLLESPTALMIAVLSAVLNWILSKQRYTKSVQFILDNIRKIRRGNVLGTIYPAAVLTSILSLVALFHLKILDRLFLKLGRV